MTESKAKLIESMEDDYSNVLKEAKSMGCKEIRALYNIPLKNMELIINALEKQIPKKPIIKQSKYCNAYHCPVCNGYIRSTNTRIEVILEENIFCGVCGQKLNWESDEK